MSNCLHGYRAGECPICTRDERIAALEAALSRMTQERDEALSLAHSRSLAIERHEAVVTMAVAQRDDMWAEAISENASAIVCVAIADTVAARAQGKGPNAQIQPPPLGGRLE